MGIIYGIHPERFLPGDGFRRHDNRVSLGGPGNYGPHGQEGIIGVDGSIGIPLHHMIWSTVYHDSPIQHWAVGVESFNSFLPQDGSHGIGILIKPGRLHIGIYPKFFHPLNGNIIKEIPMNNRESEIPDGFNFIHPFIHIKQEINTSTTGAMSRKFPVVLMGGRYNGKKLLGRKVYHTPVGGIPDTINIAGIIPPGFPHESCAG